MGPEDTPEQSSIPPLGEKLAVGPLDMLHAQVRELNEAMDNLKVHIAYQAFDLEATRRERDAALAEKVKVTQVAYDLNNELNQKVRRIEALTARIRHLENRQ